MLKTSITMKKIRTIAVWAAFCLPFGVRGKGDTATVPLPKSGQVDSAMAKVEPFKLYMQGMRGPYAIYFPNRKIANPDELPYGCPDDREQYLVHRHFVVSSVTATPQADSLIFAMDTATLVVVPNHAYIVTPGNSQCVY